MAPKALRLEAWDRLARDLDRDKLAAMTSTIPLERVIEAGREIVEGKVRGRVVVESEADPGHRVASLSNGAAIAMGSQVGVMSLEIGAESKSRGEVASPRSTLRCLAISAAAKSMKARTRADWRRSGWVRSHSPAEKSGFGGEPDERRPGIGDEAGQGTDADPGLHRLGEAEHRVDLVDDLLRRDPLAHEAGGLEGGEVVAERDPGPFVDGDRSTAPGCGKSAARP